MSFFYLHFYSALVVYLLYFNYASAIPITAYNAQATATVTSIFTADATITVVPTALQVIPLLISPTSSPTPITTITVTSIQPPATVTKVVTYTPSSSLPSPVKTWSASPNFSDLSSFHISKFAYGKGNLQLTSTDPSSNGTITPKAANLDDIPAPNDHTALRLYYPAGSINPGNSEQDQGGADFYAEPLDISKSRNVTMEYSVFFPANFSFVKGGKLPGLYGGRPGCSGGDEALDCFSTRLMWRSKGEGELYLVSTPPNRYFNLILTTRSQYAPKKKQTPEVCSTPPTSVCDSDYGLSIGRGSFKFQPGKWTSLRQTVSLNTPGTQDGAFTLVVDGNRVLDVTGIYYREGGKPSARQEAVTAEAVDTVSEQALPDGHVDDGATNPSSKISSMARSPHLLSGASGEYLLMMHPFQMYLQPMVVSISETPTQKLSATSANSTCAITYQEQSGLPIPSGPECSSPTTSNCTIEAVSYQDAITVIAVVQPKVTTTQTITISAPTPSFLPNQELFPLVVSLVEEQAKLDDAGAVGFIGIFFRFAPHFRKFSYHLNPLPSSTFFGGHEEKYATPTDQYAWFRDFSLVIND